MAVEAAKEVRGNKAHDASLLFNQCRSRRRLKVIATNNGTPWAIHVSTTGDMKPGHGSQEIFHYLGDVHLETIKFN